MDDFSVIATLHEYENIILQRNTLQASYRNLSEDYDALMSKHKAEVEHLVKSNLELSRIIESLINESKTHEQLISRLQGEMATLREENTSLTLTLDSIEKELNDV